MKKKILVLFLVIALVLASFIGYLPKVNADIDWTNYNYIVKVYSYNSNDSSYNCKILATKVNSSWSIFDDNDTYTTTDSSVNVGSIGVYYLYADIDIELYSITIYSFVSIDTYNDTTYNNGVSQGALSDNQEVYDYAFRDGVDSVKQGSAKYQEIYNRGQASIISNYEEGGSGYNSIYNAGYQKAMDDMEATEDGEANFLVMFKTIINYITDFFTVGLNVEIFGVNIGDFCVGIFLLAVVMFLLRLVFGR